MTRAKQPSPDDHLSPSRHAGSAEIAAVVARTAPAVLDLLADGRPRPRAAIVAALAGRHAKEDVVRTLMQGSRMKGCDPMRGPTLKKPLPAKPRFFRSTPERAEPISA
jgi:hypothetical protein